MFLEMSFTISEMSFHIFAEMSFGQNGQKKSENLTYQMSQYKAGLVVVTDNTDRHHFERFKRGKIRFNETDSWLEKPSTTLLSEPSEV